MHLDNCTTPRLPPRGTNEAAEWRNADGITAEEAAAKRTARALAQCKSKNARRVLPDGFKSAALHWVHKKKGFKRCRLDEIESVIRVNQTDSRTYEVKPELDHYEIKVRGRIFKLYPRKEA